jgi:FlhB-like protein
MKDIPLSQQKAVALKYPEGAEAPFVVANGKGLLAKRIIEEARQNDIRIEENTPLVEFLSEIQVGSLVPPETWEVLAQIFSVIIREEEGGSLR